MKTMAVVDAGICGFQTRIHADSDDAQNVTFKIVSGCEKARGFGGVPDGSRWLGLGFLG